MILFKWKRVDDEDETFDERNSSAIIVNYPTAATSFQSSTQTKIKWTFYLLTIHSFFRSKKRKAIQLSDSRTLKFVTNLFKCIKNRQQSENCTFSVVYETNFCWLLRSVSKRPSYKRTNIGNNNYNYQTHWIK